VFQTITANYVDFGIIKETFCTTTGGWQIVNPDIPIIYKHGDNKSDHYQAVQNTLLNGQYLNSSRFQSLGIDECLKRYNQTFIRAGNGFAVISAEDYDPSKGQKYRSISKMNFLAGTGQFVQKIDFLSRTGQLEVPFNTSDFQSKSTVI